MSKKQHKGPTPADVVPGHNGDTLAAIFTELSSLRVRVEEALAALDARGEYVKVNEAAKRLGINLRTMRAAIKTATAEGRTTVFDGIKFRSVGRGAQRGRYVVWAPDLAKTRTG